MSYEPTPHTPARTAFDDVLDALAHVDRRKLVYQLYHSTDPSYHADVDRIARERNLDSRELRLRMHHVHLPRLESAGLVVRDENERIRRGPAFDEVTPLLKLFRENAASLPKSLL